MIRLSIKKYFVIFSKTTLNLLYNELFFVSQMNQEVNRFPCDCDYMTIMYVNSG